MEASKNEQSPYLEADTATLSSRHSDEDACHDKEDTPFIPGLEPERKSRSGVLIVASVIASILLLATGIAVGITLGRALRSHYPLADAPNCACIAVMLKPTADF